MSIFLRILLGVGSAIAANRAAKHATGKTLSGQAYSWWNDTREKVSVWIADNPGEPVERVSAKLVHVVDSGVQALARLQIRGESKVRPVAAADGARFVRGLS